MVSAVAPDLHVEVGDHIDVVLDRRERRELWAQLVARSGGRGSPAAGDDTATVAPEEHHEPSRGGCRRGLCTVFVHQIEQRQADTHHDTAKRAAQHVAPSQSEVGHLSVAPEEE